ncbi:MAG: phosphonate C-P lyase system protein PhnH [Marivibrio sp.]|uniref:phosphonate C-P lyase system protein PhnH n=1 Tax=Marivibrio sp. TaxID=2039719 RepID=UPI0032EE7FFD
MTSRPPVSSAPAPAPAPAGALAPPAPGFDEPVLDAADAFRALLEATARPGAPIALPGAPPAPPPLGPGLGAVALTLIDPDAPLWLDDDLRTPAVEAWLAFHCGVRPLTEPGTAAFAFAPIGRAAALLPRLCAGAPEYPDRAATLVLSVDGFEGGRPATLSGPGLKAPAAFAPAGADVALWRALQANAARFPLGVDCLFISADALAGLPRSTRIAVDAEEG